MPLHLNDGWLVATTRVDATRISALPALGYYRLGLMVMLTLYPRPRERGPAQIVDIRGSLDIHTPAGLKRIGRLTPQQGAVLYEASTYVSERQAPMEVELDWERLEAIERIRLGGDVMLSVALRARIFTGTEFQEVDDTLSLTINQGTWVKTLNELGYSRIMLLEVPIPDSQERPELAQAVSDLAGAQQALIQGHYREAVGQCRDVLESLGLALKDSDEHSPQIDALFTGSRSMDKAARLRVLRQAAKLVTHPAKHRDEVTAEIEYGRVDAVSLIAIAAALLPMAHGARPPTTPGAEEPPTRS